MKNSRRLWRRKVDRNSRYMFRTWFRLACKWFENLLYECQIVNRDLSSENTPWDWVSRNGRRALPTGGGHFDRCRTWAWALTSGRMRASSRDTRFRRCLGFCLLASSVSHQSIHKFNIQVEKETWRRRLTVSASPWSLQSDPPGTFCADDLWLPPDFFEYLEAIWNKMIEEYTFDSI